MKKTNLPALILLCLFLAGGIALSETHIHGEIGGKVFTAEGNPYIVDSALTVAAKEKVVIKEGVHFVFKPYTGMDVYGDIVVEGAKKKPVVFTSYNDAEYVDHAENFPAAFDWNGIRIENREGEAVFRNFKIMYSVYGLKSKNREVVVHNGMFKQNGQFNFTIHDQVLEVPEGLVFFYNSEPEGSQTDTAAADTTITVKKRDARKMKKIVGAAVAGAGIIGCGVGGYYVYDAGNKYDDYDKTPLLDYEIRSKEYKKYEESRTYAAAALPTSITFVAAGAVIFFWDEITGVIGKIREEREKRKSKTTIQVSGGVLRDGGTVQVICSF